MADRDALADLVDRIVRLLDPAAVLDPDRDVIADALDSNRVAWRTGYLLEPQADPTGATLEHLGPEGWDLSAALYDLNGAAVTADTADPAAGVWTFDTDTPGPLVVSGWLYDVNAAAADAAETFATTWTSATETAGPIVSVTTAGGETLQRAAPYALQRNAAADGLRTLAASLRRRSRAMMPGSVPVNVPSQVGTCGAPPSYLLSP